VTVTVPPAIAKIAPDGKLTPRQARRILLEMAVRRQKPGTGSSEEFMRRRTAMHLWPDLRPIFKGLRWAIVGGVATRAYMPERVTKDMDVIIHPDDADEAWKRFKEAQFTFVTELAVPGYLVRTPEGVDLDVVEGRYPWINEALARTGQDAAGYPVIGLPYLVLMKTEASRGVDLGDLTRMLGLASDEQLAEVRRVFAKYAPDDSGDLETMIFLGKREMQFPPQKPAADSK
jgi:hypothetical protein